MNQRGEWSHTYSSQVYVIEPINVVTPDIVGAEYFWNNDPGFGNGTPISLNDTATVTSDTVHISLCGLATGSHKLYLRVFDSQGKYSHTYHASVLVSNTGGGILTLVVNNTGPVCVGGDIQLSVSGTMGGAVAWTGPNGFTSTLDTALINNVTLADSGTYYVTVDDGCGGTNDSTLVEINPALNITTVPAVSNICIGDTLLVDAGTYSSSVNYNWNTGDTVQVLPIIAIGNYVVTVTDQSGTCTDTASTWVVQNATFPRVWAGNLDNDWFKHKNWSCGGIPDKTVEVVIPNVSGTTGNTPLILFNQTGHAKSVLMDLNSHLNLQGELRINEP